ncbi:MAG: zinc ribbon domain-containing protein [Planctomycetota bacterium]
MNSRSDISDPNSISAAEAIVVDAELVDESVLADVGPPCSACGSPREGNSKFCTACGSPLETREAPVSAQGESSETDAALPSHYFECDNCGSQVATSVDQRSYVCPFCDSTYVKEISVQESGRQRPEFIIGFGITAEQAKQKYFEWLGKNSWFRPGDLAQKAVADKQKGVYLPFWHFSMHAASHWNAQKILIFSILLKSRI